MPYVRMLKFVSSRGLELRRYVVVLVSGALVVLVAAFLLPRILVRHRTLVDALADALQLPRDRRDFFFVNLPPIAVEHIEQVKE